MLLKEIVAFLEESIPLALQEPYDNCGLILGSLDQNLDKALISLDITDEVLEEAIETGSSLIISHHPMIFKGFKNLDSGLLSHRLILKAIQNNLAIYALHTNLDKIYGGVSFQLGEILGLKKLEFLFAMNPGHSTPNLMDPENPYPIHKNLSGLGITGIYDPPISWEAFCSLLKEKLSVQVIRHTVPIPDKISKVGLCGGSGSEFIGEAMNQGCQVYLTADIKYHQFFLEKPGLILVDIGHYETEQFSPQLIRNIISKKFPTFALSLTKKNTNPIHYSY